jgi:hypothetical protein
MLSRDLKRYIDGRRALGFKLGSQSVQLRSFVAFAEQHGDRYIKSARVLAWASKAPSPEHRRNRCRRPGPPISLGTASFTLNAPSLVSAAPSRPPVAVASAV